MRLRPSIYLTVLLATALGCSDAGPPGTAAPVAWTAAMEPDGSALLVTPVTALRGASRFGIVLTRGIRGIDGARLEPSVDFAADLAARREADPGDARAGGPVAGWSEDPDDPANPYPDPRLVRADGTVRIPDRFALRGVPDRADLAAARSRLRQSADRVGTLRGFSTTAPVRIALSSPVDPATITPETLLFLEAQNDEDEVDLPWLIDEARRRGIAPSEIALAFWFPTQPIETDLIAIQSLLAARAAHRPDLVLLTDPDPSDDLPIGVFTRRDGGGPFAGFLAASPEVSTVVAGLLPSPEFRGADGVFVAQRIDGGIPAPEVDLDFLLVLPANASPPYPVVLLQHGFGGSNAIVTELARIFTREGLAVIGISAVAHGRRGVPTELLAATPFVARDIFRQTIADQMTLLRAIGAGIDLDGDGEPELDRRRIGYLGISLGAMLGATLVAVEDVLPVAVINVGGGRLAFLGDSPGLRDLVNEESARQVGLTVDHPDFPAYQLRTLDVAQQAMDSVDGLNYARRWRIEPFAGQPARRVLMQEGIGDILVPNASTEALATAAGLDANRAMSDPMGVSGLWRFDPPGGHGIFARADVQRQALRFLLSDGTEILDPGR